MVTYKVVVLEYLGMWRYRILADGREIASEGRFGSSEEAWTAGHLAVAALG